MKTKIVTFGEILLRISKPGYQRLFQGHRMFGNYGGSEANAAISLAHLGDNVEYVTRLPYGEMGEAALMHLREFGLNVSHVVRGGDRLGTYYFEEAVAMRNSRVVYDRKNSSFYSLKHGYGISAAPTSANSGDRYITAASPASTSTRNIPRASSSYISCRWSSPWA
jgi:2-dehydro-3-deoxygluconokinase